MRLVVTTPFKVVVEATDVRHVRAEDETGAFGILPGHADFLTVLTISVVSWRVGSAGIRHVAVRGGVLTVRDGELVEIATLDAIGEDTLQDLGGAVLDRFRADAAVETESRVSTRRLQLATIRQLQRFLDVNRRPEPVGAPLRLDSSGSGRIASDPGESS